MRFLCLFLVAFIASAKGMFPTARHSNNNAVRSIMHGDGIKYKLRRHVLCLEADNTSLCTYLKSDAHIQVAAEVFNERNLVAKLELLGKLDRENNADVCVISRSGEDIGMRHVCITTAKVVADEIESVLLRVHEAAVELANGGHSKIFLLGDDVQRSDLHSADSEVLIVQALASISNIVDLALSSTGIENAVAGSYA